ncbi:MAG TPA: GAF domain-containing protein, partial [Gemmatimonadales bacterium]|nr:GAF domain-containing protein [Gemmatimonadales bacterium]
PRFADNPYVLDDPFIRFYAGAPLTAAGGQRLGSVCVMDRRPRELSAEQLRALEALARQTVAHLELRRVSRQLADSLQRVRTLSGLLPICAYCKKVRDDKAYWREVESYIRERAPVDFSHGICPDCAARHFPEAE